MFSYIRNLFGAKPFAKPVQLRDPVPEGQLELTVEVLRKITPEGVANCRRIIHRTSPELARKIIRERKILSHNSAVSFSINPGQTNQAEHAGTMLVFDWSGPIRNQGDAKQNELLHVFSPNFVESLIDRPSSGGFLSLIGFIEPDLIEIEDAGEDAMGQVRSVINH